MTIQTHTPKVIDLKQLRLMSHIQASTSPGLKPQGNFLNASHWELTGLVGSYLKSKRGSMPRQTPELLRAPRLREEQMDVENSEGAYDSDAYVGSLYEAFALLDIARRPEDLDWPFHFSFARQIFSKTYVPIEFPSVEALARCVAGGATGQITHKKSDCPVYTAGVLSGPNRTQSNVRALNLFIADYDKGHCTPAEINERLTELNLYGACGPSFSYGATTHKIAWSVKAINRKTNVAETKPSSFQLFCNGVATDAAAKEFAVSVEGFDPKAIGQLKLGETVTETVKRTTTTYQVVIMIRFRRFGLS